MPLLHIHLHTHNACQPNDQTIYSNLCYQIPMPFQICIHKPLDLRPSLPVLIRYQSDSLHHFLKHNQDVSPPSPYSRPEQFFLQSYRDNTIYKAARKKIPSSSILPYSHKNSPVRSSSPEAQRSTSLLSVHLSSDPAKNRTTSPSVATQHSHPPLTLIYRLLPKALPDIPAPSLAVLSHLADLPHKYGQYQTTWFAPQ